MTSNFLNIDKTVFLGLSERIWSVFGSIVTVLFIVKFLSPAEQGFYYTILGLLELRIFVELGLTFVIMQLSSHESSNILWDKKNNIQGDKKSINNITAIFQMFTKWFFLASLILSLIMMIFGLYFFTINGDISEVKNVWIIVVLFNFFQLVTIPFTSVLEGLKKINSIYKLRLSKVFFNHLVWWVCLYYNLGISSLLYGQMIIFLVQNIFLFKYRNTILMLLLNKSKSEIEWKKDILPFQWRASVSFLCGYFLFQIFTPLAMHLSGPVLAGKVGLTIRLVRIIADTSLVWIRTKAPIFGQLISQKNYKDLEHIFWKNLRISFALSIAGYFVFNFLVLFMNFKNYEIINRILNPTSIFYLSIAFCINGLIVGSSYYLRAHKIEPFLLPSIVGALSSTVLAYISFNFYNEMIFSILFLLNTILIGLVWSGYIFIKKRRQILNES